MLMRPRPLFRALSLTPPEPNPWIETRSAFVAAADFVGLPVFCGRLLVDPTPEISSNVVAGVLESWVLTEVGRWSSPDTELPELEGSMGMDTRCISL